MTEKPLELLGLMRRAGALEIGADRAEEATRAGKARLLLIASDASDRTIRKLANAAEGRSVITLNLPFTGGLIAERVGCGGCSAAAVTDIGFAEALLKKFAEEEPGKYRAPLDEISAKNVKMRRRRAETKAKGQKKNSENRRT